MRGRSDRKTKRFALASIGRRKQADPTRQNGNIDSAVGILYGKTPPRDAQTASSIGQSPMMISDFFHERAKIIVNYPGATRVHGQPGRIQSINSDGTFWVNTKSNLGGKKDIKFYPEQLIPKESDFYPRQKILTPLGEAIFARFCAGDEKQLLIQAVLVQDLQDSKQIRSQRVRDFLYADVLEHGFEDHYHTFSYNEVEKIP